MRTTYTAATATPADYPMLTAEQAVEQGSTPSTFFSIARFNERAGSYEIARRARLVGRELAGLLGMDLGGRRRRAANDNARRNKRRAA
jgi:hypothetical protein